MEVKKKIFLTKRAREFYFKGVKGVNGVSKGVHMEKGTQGAYSE